MSGLISLAPQTVSTDVLLEKYCKNGETTADEVFRRVARGIAVAETSEESQQYWSDKFYENMHNGAVGAGRIMSAAGTDIDVSLLNCFLVGVGDSLAGYAEDGRPGIYESIRQAGMTMQKGGGVGYNFSLLRPKGSLVRSVQSVASGPCSYMNIYDANCKTIESAGNRRGAQLGALNINHPDIIEFVEAKREPGRWNNFNISVLVNDEFMRAKDADEDIDLIHKAEPSKSQIEKGAYQRQDGLWVYSKIKARKLWDIIMKSNYDYAEPGILFEDTINKDNNLRYVEYITATNPCGEQPLPENGCCDLGPIILSRFVKKPFTSNAYFDYKALEESVRIQVRFLDNVLTVTKWALPEQKKESDSKRRIGGGFTALGNALSMLNLVYYSEFGLAEAEKIVKLMRDTAYDASVDLAIEKGIFPLFDADKYLEEGTFASRLPDTLKERIRKHGIRNSHLLSVAPVGTVSLAFADNASNGIEPPFALAYTRKKRMVDGGHQHYNVLDHAFRVYLSTLEDPESFIKALENAVVTFAEKFEYEGNTLVTKDCLPKSLVTATEMTVEQHLSMMRVVQPYICSSLSKTVNVPADYPFEDFCKVYDQAWKYKLKGVSTYRPNAILGSVLSTEKPPEEKKESPKQLTTEVIGQKTFEQHVETLYSKSFPSRADGMLQGVSTKGRFFTNQGEQKFIITVNFTKVEENTSHGLISINRPVEFLLTSNFAQSSSAWDASMRFMSLMARSGVPIPKIIENLKEITWEHGGVRYGTKLKDGKQVPLWHDSDAAAIGHAIQEALVLCGYLKEDGSVNFPVKDETVKAVVGITMEETVISQKSTKTEPPVTPQSSVLAGKKCNECGAHAVIKIEGCSRCTSCNAVGECG